MRFTAPLLLVAMVAAVGCDKPIPPAPISNEPVSGAFALSISQDGSSLLLWDWEDKLALRDLGTGQEKWNVPVEKGGAQALALSSDGKVAATGHVDRTIRLWDLEAKKDTGSLTGFRSAVTGLAFSPDGKSLASNSGVITGLGSEWKVWDWKEKKVRFSDIIRGSVGNFLYSPDGKRIFLSTDTGIYVLDADSGKRLDTLSPEEKTGVTFVALSADGKVAAQGQDDGTALVIDLADKKARGKFKGPDVPVLAVALSPDGNLLAVSSDAVYLWDVAAQKEIAKITARGRQPKTLRFIDGGKTLAIVRESKQIQLIDVASGQEKQATVAGK